jgi:PBP1b-binding outer membrane lipoprotein LpoB
MSKYISIFLLLSILSSCSDEQSSTQSYVLVGAFQFQVVEPDDAKFFRVAREIAVSYEYNLESETAYQLYSKNTNKYYMFFSPAVGRNCYNLKIEALNQKLANIELENFEKIKETIKERLGDSITYIGSEKCP